MDFFAQARVEKMPVWGKKLYFFFAVVFSHREKDLYKEQTGRPAGKLRACVHLSAFPALLPFTGLQVAKNATTATSGMSEREASVKFQFFLLSASWPP